jgi:hypothetical protein
LIVARIKITDQAHVYRIEIEGRLAGDVVDEIKTCWKSALNEAADRTLVIDISQVNGYDIAGARLLREAQHHGTTIAARNPRALCFLNEISSKDFGPTLIYRSEHDSRSDIKPLPEIKSKTATKTLLARRAAAGE